MQYPEESPPGYYTRGSTCLAGDAHRHIEAHARAAGPKARVRLEVAVRVVETRGADVLQPDGASIHADASCTEDAEPQHSIQERQGAHDPVLDGASARDACHESADKRGPSNPPWRTGRLSAAALPVPFGQRLRCRRQPDEVVQVGTDRPDDQVEDVPGLIQCTASIITTLPHTRCCKRLS